MGTNEPYSSDVSHKGSAETLGTQSCWWVNQAKTFAAARQAGELWAAKIRKDGARAHCSESNMEKLRRGDVVFNYAGIGTGIRAISRVLEPAEEADTPHYLEPNPIDPTGWRVWVIYHLLQRPVALDEIDLGERRAEARGHCRAFRKGGDVSSGAYLLCLSDIFAKYLIMTFRDRWPTESGIGDI